MTNTDPCRGTTSLRRGRAQRVEGALEVLLRAVTEATRGRRDGHSAGLVTGEAALLLRATEGLAADPGVGDARVRLAAVTAAALDTGVLPSALSVPEGAPRGSVDLAFGWLHEALAGPVGTGRERVIGAELERCWVRGVWNGDFSGLDDESLVAQSALGSPVDALHAGGDDLYALTRTVLVTTDVGRRTTVARVTVGEAEAALALALDIDDLALVAEVLWLWPMLDLPWSPPAAFALRLLDEADLTCHRFALGYGVLCALLATEPERHAAAVVTGPVLALPAPRRAGSRWSTAYRELDRAGRSALAPLVLTMVIRRAHDLHDCGALRTAVKVAFANGLLDCPAAVQAAALLRGTSRRVRSHALAG
jgi:hypothetical protein